MRGIREVIGRFLHITYRRKIVNILFAVVLIPFALFSFFLVQFVFTGNERRIYDSASQNLQHYMNNYANLFNRSLNVLNIVSEDMRMQEYMSGGSRSLADLVEIRYYLSGVNSAVVNNLGAVKYQVYKFSEHGDLPPGYIKTTDKLNPEILEKCGLMGAYDILCEFEDKDYLVLYKLNKRVNGENISVSQVKIPTHILGESFKGADSRVVYITPTGEWTQLYAPVGADEADILSIKRDYENGGEGAYFFESWLTKDSLIFSSTAPKLGSSQKNTWYGKVLWIQDKGQVYDGISATVLFLLLFAGFIALTVSSLSKILTNRLYYITNNLITKIPGIKKQGGIVLPQNKDTDEFARIESCLLETIENIQGQYLRENRLELEKKELETSLLQELINPHFLYNTLDSLKWSKGDNREHIDRLINYYRTALNKGNLFLTVENEFSIVRDYLDIQKFAYESDFRYSLKLDPSLSQKRIMKYILQPFVENSIIHGIDKRGDTGYIEVKGYTGGNWAFFEVRDNGCGMCEESLLQLNKGLSVASKSGYGIHNIRKRLENIYGRDFMLNIANDNGGFVRLCIKLEKME